MKGCWGAGSPPCQASLLAAPCDLSSLNSLPVDASLAALSSPLRPHHRLLLHPVELAVLRTARGLRLLQQRRPPRQVRARTPRSRRPGPRPEQRTVTCSGGSCRGCQASEGEDQRGAAIVREQGPSVMGISGLAGSQPSNETWGYSDVTPPPTWDPQGPWEGQQQKEVCPRGRGGFESQGEAMTMEW